MNTEINFLVKKPKKYLAPLIFGIIFVILLIGVLSAILLQKNNFAEKIQTQKGKIIQIETALQEQQKQVVGEKELRSLQESITSIKSGTVPNMSLYNHILGLLPNQDQLISYGNGEANKIILDAEFKTLKDIADYVSSLLEQNYILDTQATINNNGSVYQATLTIDIDGKLLVEELGNHD